MPYKQSDIRRAAGQTAEKIVSERAFRRADANGFSDDVHFSLTDVDAHVKARNEAVDIIYATYLETPANTTDNEFAWEAQRRVAIAHLLGESALTPSFDRYFLELPAYEAPSLKSTSDLPSGERTRVRLNSGILSLNGNIEDAQLFMESALNLINDTTTIERRIVKRVAGPENYATALKFFADKVHDLDAISQHEKHTIRDLTSEVLDGFFEVSSSDAPNFVEMTNLYASFLRLPAGSIETRFTKSIVEQSLKVLPDYSAEVTRLMISSLSKLDFSADPNDGEAVARLVNLGLRKAGSFERTDDLRGALRIASRLPRAVATDRALVAIIGLHNNVEEASSIEDADEIVARIRTIADNVVSAQDIYQALKEQIAIPAQQSARKRFRDGVSGARYTYEQEADYKKTLQRIVANTQSI